MLSMILMLPMLPLQIWCLEFQWQAPISEEFRLEGAIIHGMLSLGNRQEVGCDGLDASELLRSLDKNA